MKQQDSKNLELMEEWFLRAYDDEISTEDILQDQHGSPNTVCFLSQQMAEKLLKGFLVFHKKKFPKIHHIDKLLNLCKEIDSQFEELREEAEELSEYYISTRYPGDYPQFSFKNAKEAFKKASEIKSFVLKKIELNKK